MTTTQDVYNLAQEMEHDGIAHSLTLAFTLGAMSPYFGADLVKEVNARRMTWGEIILALYLFVAAAPDLVARVVPEDID